MSNEIYASMIQNRGSEYRSDQVKAWSHYREPVDHTPGRLAGNTRVWGDATPEVQSRVIDTLIESSQNAGLNPRETAHVLAIARIESGFNPDAAAGTTSAAGLGQFIDRTGRHYQLGNQNRFEAGAGSDALVAHFVDNRNLARSRGQGEEYIYKYHHDGPTSDYGGLGLSTREVVPRLDEYENFVRQRLGLQQEQDRTSPQQANETAQVTLGQAVSGAHSFDDAMRVMLPPRNGVSPHVTSHYGAGRGDHNHGGSDFNYAGGQSGVNLQHPTINSPIAGTVTFVGGQYGTVKIRDAEGNSHEILHTQSQSVVQGQQITAGQPIGTMGGRGPDGANDYAQHVHYQLKDSNGRLQNPEQFWNNRQQQAVAPDARTQPAARSNGAMSDGVLKFGENGQDVEGLQRSLNQLGVRDANGKPLKPDGDFGIHTREAVTAFQTANGLKVDGLAGRETLEAIGRRLPEGKVTVERAEVTGVAPQQPAARTPLISDSAHPNNALYTAIGGQLPAGTKPEVTANVTLQAMENGITSPDKLKGVVVKDGDAFVVGNNPGDRVKVDLSAPTPDLQQMSTHMQAETTQLQQQRAQPDPQVTQAR